MTLERDRNRARADLKATRERIQEIDAEIGTLQAEGTTQAEAVRAVEDWVDAKTRRDLSGFTDALANTGSVDESTLPSDPWIVAAITNPHATKGHLANAIAASGKFPDINRSGQIEALEAEKAQLQKAESRQESRLRALQVDPSEVTV